MEFQTGDILRFNEEGLKHWIQAPQSKTVNWRWKFVGVDPVAKDKWKNRCIRLKRTDLKRNSKTESWSPVFFELIDPCPHGQSMCDDCGEKCKFRGKYRSN